MILFALFILLLGFGDSQSVLSNGQIAKAGDSECLNGVVLTLVSYIVSEEGSIRYQIVPLPDSADSTRPWKSLQVVHPPTSISLCVERSPEDTYTLRVAS